MSPLPSSSQQQHHHFALSGRANQSFIQQHGMIMMPPSSVTASSSLEERQLRLNQEISLLDRERETTRSLWRQSQQQGKLPSYAPLDETNVGYKMLKSVGWSDGRGLGRNLQGNESLLEDFAREEKIRKNSEKKDKKRRKIILSFIRNMLRFTLVMLFASLKCFVIFSSLNLFAFFRRNTKLCACSRSSMWPNKRYINK